MTEEARRLPRHLAHDAAVGAEREDGLPHVIEQVAQALARRFKPLLAVGDGRAHRVESVGELADLVARLDVDPRVELSLLEPAGPFGHLGEGVR